MKIIVTLAFIGILGALFSAGVLMLRRPKGDKPANEEQEAGGPHKGKATMANALAIRVAISIALFLFILFSSYMGWIHPTGVPLTH
ncbi:DUF2909 domain-containing protein [Roseateles sp. SL47]|jgi:Protein of unknown function (DUF2909)|uniref:DUF2909 domain-containing protein n=1 Tax=Roseateles sp. SL47 TaxID=2995138 RepID=UPI00226F8A7D|nr:DUF2909 domain-containing protein [Roseateles sp. SL47]WAC74915.1 DUF2909 domain-containing protein [Roseateles sp. SL47]